MKKASKKFCHVKNYSFLCKVINNEKQEIMKTTELKVGDKFTGKKFIQGGSEYLETITITDIKKSIASDRVRIMFTHENALNTCSDFMWSDLFEEFIINFSKVK